QVVLPLMESDLLDTMLHVTEGTLSECDVRFSDDSCCCVVMASEGYPVSYEKGFEITIPEDIADDVFVAGAAVSDGKLLSDGGRVLGVTARDSSLQGAIEKAYEKVRRVSFANAFYRHDIGARALKAKGGK
ncbi:MAG: phosphoribosylamine--glycine ligase, partial [Eubacteriaceae bacterium]|nr:phosphoribosylamine--glycine ligase [Eubacteriaceae bacterium]